MPRLAVTELTLSHFRSHRTARLNLDGRPVAIYGANGAGKTNILEAVSLLSPGRGLRMAGADEIARRPEALGWKVRAVVESLHQIHELETSAEPGASRVVRIDGKSATQVALGRVTRVIWLIPAMDRLWIEGAEGRRRFLDRVVLSFEPSHADSVLTYEKVMRQRNRLLKDQITDAGWYAAIEAQMAAAGAQIQINRQAALERITAAQADAETAFPRAELSLIAPDEIPWDDAESLGQALAESRRRDLAAGRSLVGPHRSDLGAIYADKGVAARQCSTGEQKALLVSLILANARALRDDFGAPPLLLLDEVSAHLDADRRAALYDELVAVGAQAWLTGTGAELFETLSGRAQFLEVIEVDGESRIEPRDP